MPWRVWTAYTAIYLSVYQGRSLYSLGYKAQVRLWQSYDGRCDGDH
ncbi:MAG: hypothetical protein ABDH91_06300 [Bacteroidia bacterium]